MDLRNSCGGSLALTIVYRRYTGLTRGQSILLALVAGILAAIFVSMPFNYHQQHGIGSTPLIFSMHAALLALLSVPFVVRLYRKWLGGYLTDGEKLPGMDGVRAWLTPGNLICAILICKRRLKTVAGS